uniref:Coiled-coil domain-containing protein 22 homolog n=1 Tax=Meloidogyne hapla TaxID=6305 RepID=A0A1I8BU12_MELHA
MENVDQMIMDSFANELNCSFSASNDFQNLSDLGPNQIVEGVIRCLWKCSPSTITTIPSYKMPGNAVDRFKMATKISQEIKSLGINDSQIGYQTLLYPNVFESRRIFLALFERLPKEKVVVDEKKLTPLEQLKLNVGEIIAKQLAEHWTPEFCRFYDLKRIGRFWHTREGDIFGMNKEISKNDTEKEEKAVLEPLERPKIGVKPKLPPKPKFTHFVKPTDNEDQKEIFSAPSTSGEIIDKEKLSEEIASKRSFILENQNVLLRIQQEIAQLNDQIKNKQETTNLNDQRLLALLEEENAEENLEKLRNFVATAQERRLALEEKFMEAKAELIERLECAKNVKKDDYPETYNQNIIEELEEEFERKKRIRTKLLKEWQKSSTSESNGIKPENRKKMLDKILEINAMVVKQNEQIRKTASSVQQIRREIVQLDGILDRTFTAVDRWIGCGRNASGTSSPMTITQKENKQMIIITRQRAHKLLVRTHEQCALITSAIQTQGEMECQLDELTNKIELETQKGVDAQLERLLDDLMVIRAENRELEAKMENVEENEDEQDEEG